jgi:PH domain
MSSSVQSSSSSTALDTTTVVVTGSTEPPTAAAAGGPAPAAGPSPTLAAATTQQPGSGLSADGLPMTTSSTSIPSSISLSSNTDTISSTWDDIMSIRSGTTSTCTSTDTVQRASTITIDPWFEWTTNAVRRCHEALAQFDEQQQNVSRPLTQAQSTQFSQLLESLATQVAATQQSLSVHLPPSPSRSPSPSTTTAATTAATTADTTTSTTTTNNAASTISTASTITTTKTPSPPQSPVTSTRSMARLRHFSSTIARTFLKSPHTPQSSSTDNSTTITIRLNPKKKDNSRTTVDEKDATAALVRDMSPIVRFGWLSKAGSAKVMRVRMWRKRHVVLRFHTITLFKNSNTHTPLEQISLQNLASVHHVVNKDKGCRFIITPTHGTAWKVTAASAHEAREWVEAISHVAYLHNNSEFFSLQPMLRLANSFAPGKVAAHSTSAFAHTSQSAAHTRSHTASIAATSDIVATVTDTAVSAFGLDSTNASGMPMSFGRIAAMVSSHGGGAQTLGRAALQQNKNTNHRFVHSSSGVSSLFAPIREGNLAMSANASPQATSSSPMSDLPSSPRSQNNYGSPETVSGHHSGRSMLFSGFLRLLHNVKLASRDPLLFKHILQSHVLERDAFMLRFLLQVLIDPNARIERARRRENRRWNKPKSHPSRRRHNTTIMPIRTDSKLSNTSQETHRRASRDDSCISLHSTRHRSGSAGYAHAQSASTNTSPVFSTDAVRSAAIASRHKTQQRWMERHKSIDLSSQGAAKCAVMHCQQRRMLGFVYCVAHHREKIERAYHTSNTSIDSSVAVPSDGVSTNAKLPSFTPQPARTANVRQAAGRDAGVVRQLFSSNSASKLLSGTTANTTRPTRRHNRSRSTLMTTKTRDLVEHETADLVQVCNDNIEQLYHIVDLPDFRVLLGVIHTWMCSRSGIEAIVALLQLSHPDDNADATLVHKYTIRILYLLMRARYHADPCTDGQSMATSSIDGSLEMPRQSRGDMKHHQQQDQQQQMHLSVAAHSMGTRQARSMSADRPHHLSAQLGDLSGPLNSQSARTSPMHGSPRSKHTDHNNRTDDADSDVDADIDANGVDGAEPENEDASDAYIDSKSVSYSNNAVVDSDGIDSASDDSESSGSDTALRTPFTSPQKNPTVSSRRISNISNVDDPDYTFASHIHCKACCSVRDAFAAQIALHCAGSRSSVVTCNALIDILLSQTLELTIIGDCNSRNLLNNRVYQPLAWRALLVAAGGLPGSAFIRLSPDANARFASSAAATALGTATMKSDSKAATLHSKSRTRPSIAELMTRGADNNHTGAGTSEVPASMAPSDLLRMRLRHQAFEDINSLLVGSVWNRDSILRHRNWPYFFMPLVGDLDLEAVEQLENETYRYGMNIFVLLLHRIFESQPNLSDQCVDVVRVAQQYFDNSPRCLQFARVLLRSLLTLTNPARAIMPYDVEGIQWSNVAQLGQVLKLYLFWCPLLGSPGNNSAAAGESMSSFASAHGPSTAWTSASKLPKLSDGSATMPRLRSGTSKKAYVPPKIVVRFGDLYSPGLHCEFISTNEDVDSAASSSETHNKHHHTKSVPEHQDVSSSSIVESESAERIRQAEFAMMRARSVMRHQTQEGYWRCVDTDLVSMFNKWLSALNLTRFDAAVNDLPPAEQELIRDIHALIEYFAEAEKLITAANRRMKSGWKPADVTPYVASFVNESVPARRVTVVESLESLSTTRVSAN